MITDYIGSHADSPKPFKLPQGKAEDDYMITIVMRATGRYGAYVEVEMKVQVCLYHTLSALGKGRII